MLNIGLHRPGIEPRPPPLIECGRSTHWAMESVHNMGVLVSWPPGRGQILCKYSTPPPTSIPTLKWWGGGGVLATTPPQYLLTHSYKENPLTGNNTQQHTRTPNNRQQHTTTVDNSTLIHKITNVPLFKKLWDIIFFWWDNHFMSHFLNCPSLRSGQFKGSKKSWPPQNVPRNGS